MLFKHLPSHFNFKISKLGLSQVIRIFIFKIDNKIIQILFQILSFIYNKNEVCLVLGFIEYIFGLNFEFKLFILRAFT